MLRQMTEHPVVGVVGVRESLQAMTDHCAY